MAIVNTSINAPTDGTYGLPNSIIGKLKTILLNDTNVAIVSDNDPANTTKRVLVYSIASQNHNIKIEASSGTKIVYSLLKLDGSTTLESVSWTVSNIYSYEVRFLYNTKAHFLVITNSSELCVLFWAVNCGDTENGWYFRKPSSGHTGVCYFNASDAAGGFANPSYATFDLDGKFIGIPVRFRATYNYSKYYHTYMYGANIITSPIGFLSDGTYTYLSDENVVIADRVPS